MTATGYATPLDQASRVELYRTMVYIRIFEEAVRQEYRRSAGAVPGGMPGGIRGPVHLAAGQEPVAAGVCAHLTHRDAVLTGHRSHHFAVAHGVDPGALLAEIYGRRDGLGHGRGGHAHLFDTATHFYSTDVVTGSYPLALGVAFAFRRHGTDQVAVAVTGDGGANQGAFHESLNLAARWQLPVVFVVEDNGWAISTARDRATAAVSNADRAAGYGMPGELVDGNDVESVYRATGRAVASARAGRGPSLIEVRTLRLWGHDEDDSQQYRGDLASLGARDPLPAYERTLRSAGLLDDAAVARAREQAAGRVAGAIASALGSPAPDPATALRYVFQERAAR